MAYVPRRANALSAECVSCNYKARLNSSFVEIIAVAQAVFSSSIFLLFSKYYDVSFFFRGGNTVDLEKSAKAIQVDAKMKGAMYFT